jgi:hypothetical protein
MHPLLLLITLILLLLPCSWWVAAYWQSHGSWWLHSRPHALLDLIELGVSAASVVDITQAEDLLEFLSYWIPVFLAGFIFILGVWAALLRRRAGR